MRPPLQEMDINKLEFNGKLVKQIICECILDGWDFDLFVGWAHQFFEEDEEVHKYFLPHWENALKSMQECT